MADSSEYDLISLRREIRHWLTCALALCFRTLFWSCVLVMVRSNRSCSVAQQQHSPFRLDGDFIQQIIELGIRAHAVAQSMQSAAA